VKLIAKFYHLKENAMLFQQLENLDIVDIHRPSNNKI
jgi:hypothetical protein